MMIKKYIVGVAVVLTATLFTACSGKFVENDASKAAEENELQIQDYIKKLGQTFTKTTSGLYYQRTKTNTAGQNVELGDRVKVNVKYTLLNGTFLDSTKTPIYIGYYNTSTIAGVLEALSLLREGEKGTFLIPASLAFQSQSSAVVPAWSVIKANLEVFEYKNENEQIDEYIITKKLTLTEKTTSGLRLIKTVEDPTQAALKTGETVTVKYKGLYLDDKVFDPGTNPLTATIGGGGFISGFSEAIAKLKRGEKAIAILPSAIAYGVAGNSTIDPYTPLVFEIEIVK